MNFPVGKAYYHRLNIYAFYLDNHKYAMALRSVQNRHFLKGDNPVSESARNNTGYLPLAHWCKSDWSKVCHV
ncbi:unknown [Bacteroides intestinalis CAG:315]|nr:unknown [Bacteroides intestinalis CAG:315]